MDDSGNPVGRIIKAEGKIVKLINRDKAGNIYELIIENMEVKGYKVNGVYYPYNKIIENEDDLRSFKLYVDRGRNKVKEKREIVEGKVRS